VASPEPAFPIAALDPTPDGKAAEDAWWNSILLWGRDHHDKVERICKWSVDLGHKVPTGTCD